MNPTESPWKVVGSGRCMTDWQLSVPVEATPTLEEIEELFKTAPLHNFRSYSIKGNAGGVIQLTLTATLDTSD
jgi:hypothetical protein